MYLLAVKSQCWSKARDWTARPCAVICRIFSPVSALYRDTAPSLLAVTSSWLWPCEADISRAELKCCHRRKRLCMIIWYDRQHVKNFEREFLSKWIRITSTTALTSRHEIGLSSVRKIDKAAHVSVLQHRTVLREQTQQAKNTRKSCT